MFCNNIRADLTAQTGRRIMVVYLLECWPKVIACNSGEMNDNKYNNRNTNNSSNSTLECMTLYKRVHSAEYCLPPRM